MNIFGTFADLSYIWVKNVFVVKWTKFDFSVTMASGVTKQNLRRLSQIPPRQITTQAFSKKPFLFRLFPVA